MNRTSPANIFGGTWEQITDRFLYCAHSSKATGCSSTITEANLPSHTHTFTGTQATDDLQFRRILSDETGANIVHAYSNNGVFSLNQKSGDTWSYAIDSAHNSVTTDLITWTYTPSGTLSETGSGEEFLPPYMTVYAWYRAG